MQPSTKYASTEKTSSGFTYKETDDNIATLFPLNSEIDKSIAYSTNTIPDYKKYSMACWAANAASWYVNQSIHADIPWRYSSSSTRHAYVKSLSVSKDWACNKQCNFMNIFLSANSQNREYNFGYNTSASSTAGSFSSKIISDFDVNKVLFTASVSGITKTEWETFLSDGTVTANHSIALADFLENPANYMISDFQVKSLATWNSNTSKWVSNELIYPTVLIDSEEMRSIVGYKILFYKNLHMGCTSDYAGANLYCDNMTVYTNAWEYGTMTSQIDQINGNILGPANTSLLVYPDLSGDEIISHCEDGVTGTFSTPWTKFNIGNDFIDMYESDTYTLVQDTYPADASTSHPNAWRKHFRQMIFGAKVSECLAQIGVYFWDDTVSALNDSSCTPDDMSLSESMYLGAMNSAGVTSGVWIRGEDIDDYTGPNKDGSIIHPDFDPSGGGGGGGGGYDDDPWHGISFSGVGVGGAGAFAKCYYMTSTELANLRSWMNSINVPEGFDPMQQIIGLSQVPVTLSGDAPENVVFVNSSAVYDPGVTTRAVDTGVSTQQAMGTPISYYLGSVDIVRRMQERGEPYLDYDCQIELYLPLIGMFSLDTQAVMGRTISAYAVLDPVSGTLAAYAYVTKDGQNLPVAYGSTSIGVDLPISAQQLSVSRAALKQANAQLGASLLSGALTMLAAASSGGKSSGSGAKTSTGSSGLSAAGIREAGSDYMKASQVGNVFGDFMQWGRTIRQLSYGNNTAVAGSFGGSTAQWSYPFTPYVKIIRPRFEKPSNYAHSQGVPCVQTKTIGSCTGFIQCVGADVSGITGATDLELQAIQAALSNGIYAGGGS